jgi:hypothetical protein
MDGLKSNFFSSLSLSLSHSWAFISFLSHSIHKPSATHSRMTYENILNAPRLHKKVLKFIREMRHKNAAGGAN